VKVAVTGASGLIGSALVPALQRAGHEVVRLVRRPTRSAEEVRWDPDQQQLDPEVLADVDGVVHLAGVGVADRRWSDKRRSAIIQSRVDGTTTISQALAAAAPRSRVLVSASGIDWYGDTGDRPVTEADPAGTGFLSDVTVRWEAATSAASDAGVRVALCRSSLVMSPKGGIMGRLLPLFKLGLGGRLSGGAQYWPWISLADEVSAMVFLLERDISGPVNLAGPEQVTNAEFTATLGRVLHRPTVATVPALALKLALGQQMAEELTLTGSRALPQVLLDNGFEFQHPTLESALRWITSRPA